MLESVLGIEENWRRNRTMVIDETTQRKRTVGDLRNLRESREGKFGERCVIWD